MTTAKIRLEQFGRDNYADLVAWVESEEALMQFAGPLLKFPLAAEQLDVSLSDKNRIAFRVVDNERNRGIGHAEIYLSENSARLGRILIGEKERRGKRLGQQIVGLLLDFSFTNFDIPLVELNVFDWNTAAIKCYEKVGFTVNPAKTIERKIKDKTWIAINMTIDRWRYEKVKQLSKITSPQGLQHDNLRG
jgi:RimJ/RimL family protein N-acetyltransferase